MPSITPLANSFCAFLCRPMLLLIGSLEFSVSDAFLQPCADSLTHSFIHCTNSSKKDGGKDRTKVLPCSSGVCNFSIPKDGGCDQEPLSSSWVKLGDPREGKTVQGFYNCFHLFYGSLAPKWTQSISPLTLQMMKLRLREMKSLVQDHIACYFVFKSTNFSVRATSKLREANTQLIFSSLCH